MKKTILSLIVLLALGGGIFFFYIMPQAKNTTEELLQKNGFRSASIQSQRITLNGIRFFDIATDDDFNKISQITLNLNWLKFITKKEIKNLRIEGVKISSTLQEIENAVYTLNKNLANSILESHIETASINNATWDISTIFGPLRFLVNVDTKKQNGLYNYNVTTKAEQHQLAFDLTIDGSLDEENGNRFNLNIERAKANLYPLSFARLTGWGIYEDGSFSGQMDAGKGNLFSIPLSNLQITIGQQNDFFPVLLRADISGSENSKLSTDVQLSNNIDSQDFQMVTELENLNSLETILNLTEPIFSDSDEKTTFSIKYLKERRFADGPWPFEVSVFQADKKASGVFLFYADKFDLRGSAEGNKEIVALLKKIIPHDPENSSDELIRTDNNLKALLISKIKPQG